MKEERSYFFFGFTRKFFNHKKGFGSDDFCSSYLYFTSVWTVKANIKKRGGKRSPSHSHIYRKQWNQIYFLHMIGELKGWKQLALNEWINDSNKENFQTENDERWEMLNVVWILFIHIYILVTKALHSQQRSQNKWRSVGFFLHFCFVGFNLSSQFDSQQQIRFGER